MKKLQSAKHFLCKRWQEFRRRKEYEYKAIDSRSSGSHSNTSFLRLCDHPQQEISSPKCYFCNFVAIYVGKERKRYVIPLAHLNHPAFKLLLEKTKDEFGCSQNGVLSVACEVIQFDRLLNVMQKEHPKATSHLAMRDLEKYYAQKYNLSFDRVSMEE